MTLSWVESCRGNATATSIPAGKSLPSARGRHTPQSALWLGVEAAAGERRGRGESAQEEVVEQVHRVGEVEAGVVVGVARLQAGRRWGSQEQHREHVDRIGDVVRPVAVAVAPPEAG